MGKFKVDDKIRPTREVMGADGVWLDPSDEYTVLEVEHDDYDGDLDVKIAVVHGQWGDTWVDSEHFELAVEPLDPSKVKVGDVVRLEREDGTLIQAKVFGVDPVSVNAPERTLRLYGIPEWVLIGKDSYALTDHQPVAPKPEWKPGMSGTATVRTVPNVRVMRLDGVTKPWVSAIPFAPAGDVKGEGQNRHDDWQVSDFVPDEPRPLPTREQVSGVISHAMDDHGDSDVAAEWVLALLRGESL
jgi:hypothetical protein